jgi:hypothetical protein
MLKTSNGSQGVFMDTKTPQRLHKDSTKTPQTRQVLIARERYKFKASKAHDEITGLDGILRILRILLGLGT